MVHVDHSFNPKGNNTKRYVVLIGYNVCCCTMTEEHNLVLKVLSVPHREEVRKGWRKLHNLELH